MSDNKKVIGKCPKCGGDVYKTQRGWRCDCGFTFSNLVANRNLTDNDAIELLEKKEIIIDYLQKEDRYFSSVLSINPQFEIVLNSHVATCPRCGGKVYVGVRAFNCGNFNAPHNCNFTAWRNINGHHLSLNEIREICEKGYTTEPSTFFTDDGSMYTKRLGLSPEKDKVVKI